MCHSVALARPFRVTLGVPLMTSRPPTPAEEADRAKGTVRSCGWLGSLLVLGGLAVLMINLWPRPRGEDLILAWVGAGIAVAGLVLLGVVAATWGTRLAHQIMTGAQQRSLDR